jgi:hypothetical protein
MNNTAPVDNGAVIEEFIAQFAHRDASKLAPYFDEDIVFENYGDPVLKGRDRLVSMWAGVLSNVTPPPPEGGGFSLCRLGFATGQPGP